MIRIRVPATTANMGPGFDCIGMALQMYNTILAEEIPKGLEIIVKKQQSIPIPTDETNLIYQTMIKFYRSIDQPIPGIRLIQDDNIPLTRGLGSSAACIVAGLMIANRFSGKNYSKEELADIAAKIEGHPDNTTPALIGGMISGVLTDERLQYMKIDVKETLSFGVMIPDFPLATEKARQVVPKSISLEDAIYNTSRAALLTAAMIKGEIDLIWTAMGDRYHQPYRKELIPGMDEIFHQSKKAGAKGVFLSGAGPTLIAVVTDRKKFEEEMNPFLGTLETKWDLHLLKTDIQGAQLMTVNEGEEA